MNDVNYWAQFHQHRDNHDPCTISSCLTWTPDDPFAIKVEFFNHFNGETVTWYWSRDHLTTALATPIGAGDVRFLPPVDGWLRVTLSSPSGHADFTVDADIIREFLADTFKVCPAGTEVDDLDTEAELFDLLLAEGM